MVEAAGRIGSSSEHAAASPVAAEPEEGIAHAPGLYFRAHTFHEDALAGHHQHALVTLVDIPLFVIRDEDVFKTPGDRATAIARALQEALHTADRFFIRGEDEGLPAIFSVSHHGGYPRLVLQATRADAVAASRRSGRIVDQQLLADWWLALLKDLLRVVFFNQPPQFTRDASAAMSLASLREKLWERQTGPVSPERIITALAAMSPADREQLRKLAFQVQQQFTGRPEPDPSSDHLQ